MLWLASVLHLSRLRVPSCLRSRNSIGDRGLIFLLVVPMARGGAQLLRVRPVFLVRFSLVSVRVSGCGMSKCEAFLLDPFVANPLHRFSVVAFGTRRIATFTMSLCICVS
mmetsp:Transcript_9449/g.25141  ORF Transcript_9449/g.25141 Transcript_9449/m.25141 type:complete len:110 (+) Transcript_9449:153-482(+)